MSVSVSVCVCVCMHRSMVCVRVRACVGCVAWYATDGRDSNAPRSFPQSRAHIFPHGGCVLVACPRMQCVQSLRYRIKYYNIPRSRVRCKFTPGIVQLHRCRHKDLCRVYINVRPDSKLFGAIIIQVPCTLHRIIRIWDYK